MNYASVCLDDISTATKRWSDWLFLVWYDFKLPYRGTLVGPLWQMVQIIVWVVALSLIFSHSELGSRKNYITYITCGVTFFGFISSILNGSPALFTQRSTQLLNIPMPLMIFVYRSVTLNMINLLIQLPVAFTVSLLTGGLNKNILYVFPGVLIYYITSIWITLLFAIIGARFKDLKYTISSLMRLLFFISPIFWVPSVGGARSILATFNPISYFLEILRAPFLGESPTLLAYGIVLLINIFGIGTTATIFVFFRRRLFYWL